MTLETVLNIASFAMSVGGVAALFLPRKRADPSPGESLAPSRRRDTRRDTVLAIILAALLATTGVAFYAHSKHAMVLNRVEEEILEVLKAGPKTSDEIYLSVFPRPFPTMSEALFRAVERGRIGHEPIELRVDGKPVMVLRYYLTP